MALARGPGCHAVPPLLLHPLVENAIKHSISPCLEGGQLRLEAVRTGQGVLLRVANTGRPLVSGHQQDIGLGNLQRRLALLPSPRPILDLRQEGVWTMEEWMAENPSIDALFLDVQMPGLDGLSLRACLDPKLPVVFVTAFAEHAVPAFDLEAADYLLKPVTTERLVRALDRVRRRLERDSPTSKPAEKSRRYPIQAGGGLIFLDLARTTHFELEGDVVWAYAGEKFRTSWRRLGEVELHFPDAGLFRIHRHLLVRLESVVGLRPSEFGRVKVRLQGGVELEASRGATPKLKERLGL